MSIGHLRQEVVILAHHEIIGIRDLQAEAAQVEVLAKVALLQEVRVVVLQDQAAVVVDQEEVDN